MDGQYERMVYGLDSARTIAVDRLRPSGQWHYIIITHNFAFLHSYNCTPQYPLRTTALTTPKKAHAREKKEMKNYNHMKSAIFDLV